MRLKLFAESIESVKRHASVEIDGRRVVLTGVRAAGRGAIARLEGVASRDAAEALRGKLVTVDRSALPPLEPGEYYHADVIGLACVSAAGDVLGRVVALENYGAGDLIEIKRANGTRALVPFRAGVAELEDGRVVVDPAFLA